MIKSKQFNVLFSTSKFGFNRNYVVEHVENEQLKCKGDEQWQNPFQEELLAIRRIFSLVDMITNTKFSNCPNVFKIGEYA